MVCARAYRSALARGGTLGLQQRGALAFCGKALVEHGRHSGWDSAVRNIVGVHHVMSGRIIKSPLPKLLISVTLTCEEESDVT